jgi:hypothetical protein
MSTKGSFKIQPNCYIWGVSEDVPMIASPQPVFQMPSYKPIRKLRSGSGVNFLIDEDYKLMSWGKSKLGMLGLDLTAQSSEPIVVLADTRVCKVEVGNEHVVALTLDGKVLTWGSNQKKQLGRPSEGPIARIPGVVASLENRTITKIAVYGDSSYAISSKGEVFSWGSNMNMELGHSSTSYSVLEPTLVAAIGHPVKNIVQAGGFYLALCQASMEDISVSVSQIPQLLEGDQSDALKECQRQNEELKQELETLKTLQVKTVPSQGASRRPSESKLSFKVSEDESKFQYSRLLENVVKLITRLKAYYDILFNIDQTMIFAFQSRGGGSVQGVVSNIHMAGEALESFSANEMKALRQNESLDPNLREQLVVFEKIALDALNLRKVNYVCGKMFLRCVKLKSNSYEEVRKYLKDKEKNSTIPQKNIIEEFQAFCLKVTTKIRDDTIEVESLQQGVNDLTSYAMTFALDTALSFSESWMLLNNVLSKVNPEDLMADAENARKIVLIELWTAYKDVGKSSLDILMEKTKYDSADYPSFQDYATKLFIVPLTQESDHILVTVEQKVAEIKPKLTELPAKKMYRVITENIELRKLLNETHRKLLSHTALTTTR